MQPITFKHLNNRLWPHVAMMPDCAGGKDCPGPNGPNCLCKQAIDNALPVREDLIDLVFREAESIWKQQIHC